MRFNAILLVLALSVGAEAGKYKFRQTVCTNCNRQGVVTQTVNTVVKTSGLIIKETVEALNEVNAARATRGLRPFVHDPNLTVAAQACASIRSSSRIAGHLANDFSYLPGGVSASASGCGALELSWGWGTCRTYDNYTYAGAAVVMGADGKRYMHLFVR